MRRFAGHGIAARMAFLILLVSLAASLAGAALHLWLQYGARVQEVEAALGRVEQGDARAIVGSLWRFDWEDVRVQLEGVLQHPGLRWAEVDDGRGKRVTVGEWPAAGGAIVREIPLRYRFLDEDRPLGTLRLAASLEFIRQGLVREALISLVLEGGKVFLVALAIFVLFYRLVARHLMTAAEYAAVANPERRGPPLVLERRRGVRPDELDILVQAIGAMYENSRRSVKELEAVNRRLQAEVEERQRMEETLKESERRYRRLFNSANDAIFMFEFRDGSPGIYIEVNDIACERLGYSRDELKSMRLEDIITPEVRERVPFYLSRLVNEGRAVFESVHLAKDGRRIPVEVSANAFEHNGRTTILSVARDVTERKKAEELLVQTEKMMTVGGLAAGMAHEINNPLGIVLQSVQNVQRRLSPELDRNRKAAERVGVSLEDIGVYLRERDIPRMLASIREAGERAAGIVANMLQFSRRSQSSHAPTNLASLLEQALDLAGKDYDLKKRYDFRRILVVREYAPELPLVPCTATEIEQVVLNLLKNAAQSISCREYGGETPTIVLRTAREDGWARIEVEDNGPGMDEATRRRVFEPFFTTKEPGVGTGLGLSVSYFIVSTKHRGTMEASSEAGRGARFTIRLPLAP